MARLTEDQKLQAFEMRADGRQLFEIAKELGVHKSTISRLFNKEQLEDNEGKKHGGGSGDQQSEGKEKVEEKEGQQGGEQQEVEAIHNQESDTALFMLPGFMKSVQGAVKTAAEAVQDEILTEKINKAAMKVAESLRPIQVVVDGKKMPEMEGGLFHEKFHECLNVSVMEKQLFMGGPMGSGKTTLAQNIADALKINYGYISCSAGLSEAHVLGRMLFDGTYVPAPFVEIFEKGGVFLFDEIDAADSNMLLVINSALANGQLSVPNRREKPYAKRHKDFICIVAGNTWGSGGADYHGRNFLDAAFLDRFAVSKVEIDYDENLESMIGGNEIASAIHKLRAKIKEKNIRKHISTRVVVSTAKQMYNGQKFEDIIDRLTIGWSKEELEKVKINEIKQLNPKLGENFIQAEKKGMKKGKVIATEQTAKSLETVEASPNQNGVEERADEIDF